MNDLENDSKEEPQLALADVSARIVAFGVDVGLFTAGYFLTLKLFSSQYPVTLNPNSGVWMALWTGLFLLYHAFFASEGRVSLGKRLLGIHVVTADNEPLSLGQSVIRALCYLPSSILNLGFAWSLLNASRQCWHDLAVGSVVVADEPPTPGRRAFVRALAGGYLALVGSLWYWHNVASPRYESLMAVAGAKVGLSEIVKLQKIHRILHGRYTDDMRVLARVSGQPDAFLRDMSNLFDRKDGVVLKATPKTFSVRARATDPSRTLIAYNGP